jgi:hypothetical protein
VAESGELIVYVILLALGFIGAAAGAVLVAINLPIDQVATGRMLVVAGMIAIAAGAILAGLAKTNRRLREIAEALEMAPFAHGAGAVEPEATVDTAPPAAETPPKPDVPATASAPNPARDLSDLRPGAPLPVSKPGGVTDKTPSAAPKSESPKPPAVQAPALAAPPAPPPQASPPEPKISDFDTMWSNATKAARASHEGTPAREPPPSVPPASNTPRSEAPAGKPTRGAEDRAPASETVKIFKSGVIDGMAYALFTDGSIEAELPEGTVRFATVDELRVYLDEAGPPE